MVTVHATRNGMLNWNSFDSIATSSVECVHIGGVNEETAASLEE